MSIISNMITKAVGDAIPFINDNPTAGINRIAGYVGGKSSRTQAKGPLASLYNTKKGLNTWQYPEDLGQGAFQNWIVFNVLDSVQTTGAAGSSFGSLGGVTNAPIGPNGFGGGPAAQGFSLINSAIAKTIGGTKVGAALNSIGIKNMNLFTTAQKVRSTSTSIALYIPNTVVFNQSNEYSETSLTQDLGLAISAGLAVGQLAQATKGGSKPSELAPFGLEAAAGLAGVDKNAILYNFTGTVLNPQIEVIFQKTSLRTFQFDFTLAARSRSEMQQIHGIVNQFRAAAAPSFAAGGAGRYLIPPSEFDISFIFSGSPASMIPRISTCVLETVVCDLAPSGIYTVFENDGRPVSVRLQLNFKEVDLITKDKTKAGF